MTQEDKDLLLIDLLARLPYGVKIRLGDYDYQVCGYNSEKEMPVKIWYYYDSNLTLKSYIDVYVTDYRPYLRPMSSMTEEEKKDLLVTIVGNKGSKYFQVLSDGSIDNTDAAHQDLDNFTMHWINFDGVNTASYVDWCNKNHFDYRGLIEKGLAIAVTENNNPYKK